MIVHLDRHVLLVVSSALSTILWRHRRGSWIFDSENSFAHTKWGSQIGTKQSSFYVSFNKSWIQPTQDSPSFADDQKDAIGQWPEVNSNRALSIVSSRIWKILADNFWRLARLVEW